MITLREWGVDMADQQPMDNADLVDCRFCAEPVLRKAIKCKHCGEFFSPLPATQANSTGIGMPEEEKQSGLGIKRKISKPKNHPMMGVTVIITCIWFVFFTIDIIGHNNTGYSIAIFSVLCSLVLVPILWKIGDTLRKFAVPQTIYVSDGFAGMVNARIFWSIGPQILIIFVAILFASIFIADKANSVDAQNAAAPEVDVSPPVQPSIMPSSSVIEGVASVAAEPVVTGEPAADPDESNIINAAAQLVSEDAELTELDQKLFSVYSARVLLLPASARAQLQTDQAEWFKNYRDKCEDRACLDISI